MQRLPPLQPQQEPQTVVTPPAAVSVGTPVNPPTFRRISYRSSVFKVGFGGMILATLLFVVGYAAPAWAGDVGLWLNCLYEECYSTTDTGSDWLNAVRSMETLALVCFVVCIAVELYQDVFKIPPPRDNRAVEILGTAAGVFGLIGIAVFGAERPRTSAGFSFDSSSDYSFVFHKLYLHWGFGLAAAGSILIILCSILIAVSRMNHGELTNQALGNSSVSPGNHSAIPMQRMMSSSPAVAGFPYIPTYPYPYPYLYPAPHAIPLTTPAQPVPAVAAQGLPVSQVPECYIMVQGHMVPVYKQTSSTVTNLVPTAPAVPGTPVDGEPTCRP